MPGYLYIVSVMSAGLLSVLLLALRTEKLRAKAVDDALAKLPGILPGRRVYAGRRAMAVDDRNQVLCVIRAETQTVRLNVVPFGDLQASELWVDGKLVSRVERGSPFESIGRRSRRVHEAGEIRLRIEARDRHAPEHELTIPDLRLAKYWQSQLRAMISATETTRELADGTALRRTQAAAGADRRATIQPGIARKPRETEAPVRTAPQVGNRDNHNRSAPLAGKQDSNEPRTSGGRLPAIVSPQLRAALRRYLSSAMPGNGRLVVSERKLRDACAPKLALIRFHDQMNRLRRAKALQDYRLSYSRKDETWRISRADERRAAA